jgi:hypothetical protein
MNLCTKKNIPEIPLSLLRKKILYVEYFSDKNVYFLVRTMPNGDKSIGKIEYVNRTLFYKALDR